MGKIDLAINLAKKANGIGSEAVKLTSANVVSDCGYSRLKNIFRKGINYQSYENMVSTTSHPIMGNIPNDLLQLILKANPITKKQAILKAQEAYINASYLLTGMTKINIQAVNRSKISLDSAVNMLKSDNIGLLFTDKIYNEKSTEIILKAEQAMLDKFKTILPMAKNVKITNIGQGAYSDVYKCEIFGTEEKKLVADRIIKCYKSDNNFNRTLFEKTNKIFSQYSDEEIVSYARSKEIELDLNKVKEKRKLFKDTLESIKLQTSDTDKYMATMHGANAEANATEYIRYMNGHKISESQGLVLPDMFVLSDNPFSISKFLDGTIHGNMFNFKRLGLEHSDLSTNPGNLINGVCIDIGGIETKESLSTVSKLVKEARSKGLSDSPRNFLILKRKSRQSNIIGDKEATRILKLIQDSPIDKQEDMLEEMFVRYKDNKKITQVLEEIKSKQLFCKKPKEETCERVDDNYINNLFAMDLWE